jgi:hypothetical protein
MEINSGYHGCYHNCTHESCFENREYEGSCSEKALSGVDSFFRVVRITNFEVKNCNHDCVDFKKKRSILDRIFLRD